MWNSALKGTAGLFLAAILSAPAWGVSDHPGTAYPGTLNYVEGQVSIGSQPVDSKSIGTAQLGAGETITTQLGKAEVLLTPGVFLRVGDSSEVKMIAPNLTDTEVAIQKGEATVEVTNIHPENRLIIDEGDAATRLEKKGFYDFNADQGIVRVFSGQAEVQENDRSAKLKGGHEVMLAAENLQAHGFDKNAYEGDLYNWSKLRSSYMAEANADVAPIYEGYGPGWYGAGWYWDPWLSSYAFVPGGADSSQPIRMGILFTICLLWGVWGALGLRLWLLWSRLSWARILSAEAGRRTRLRRIPRAVAHAALVAEAFLEAEAAFPWWRRHGGFGGGHR